MRMGEILASTTEAAVSAGTMESSTGSATAAPIPRSKVLLETCFRVRITFHLPLLFVPLLDLRLPFPF
jgi:hypothetical protein